MATILKKSFLTLFYLFFVGLASVFGCECSARNDFEVELGLSKAVFFGEVVGMDDTRKDAIITFRADKIWKGDKSETVSVKTNDQGKACGFVFKKGERYLVYAYNDGSSLRTSICTCTVPAGYAVDDLRQLDDTGWSPTANELRARLIVLPSDKPDPRFCRIYIEMQNVGIAAGQRKIRFDPDRLDLQVTDVKNGNTISKTMTEWSGQVPGWEPTLIPFQGSIRFRINFAGMAINNIEASIVSIGPDMSWVLPADGSYMLSGKLTIRPEKGDHPVMDWSGTLNLPPVRIPKVK